MTMSNSKRTGSKSGLCPKDADIIRKKTDVDERDIMDEIMSDIDRDREEVGFPDEKELWKNPLKGNEKEGAPDDFEI